VKIRFPYNQIGLALEYYAHGAWRCALLLNHSKIEAMGGLSLAKSKILLSITERYELTPPGEYHEDGMTISCI